MKRRGFQAFAGAICSLLLGSAVVNAHEDPLGEIHPEVSEKDGNFAIKFRASIPNQTPEDWLNPKYFGMIFSPQGKLLAPRHAIPTSPPDKEHSDPESPSKESLRVGELTGTFTKDPSGKPGYAIESPDGSTRRVKLLWPDGVKLVHLESSIPTKEGIAVIGKEDLEILKVYWFPLEEGVKPTILTIGVTECIYDFPVASNPVFAGGRLWVAYMRPEMAGAGDDKKKVTKLRLWSWKPGEKDARDEELDSPGDWNTSLSLCAIGDRLCLAYHCVNYSKWKSEESRIVTVFREAK
ncbi:hypothetical protein OKA04_12045 [Luteolibacter flavescens]|uniref:Uncharacterized protein n=1 Tax=Luteolibacter flavescens TaxID=1859460 RepID=A0ABT3FPF9_9BACT|nr:hypothetical protein [Luteolibacter flavescens]MCW1885462.1 hypothetical protein [Luteolibacter flavescens]